MLRNDFYLELSAGKYNVLQILKDVCSSGNDEAVYHVPQKFIASLFMVTERDIDLPPYPDEYLTRVREFLDAYCDDDNTITVDLNRGQIKEIVDAVTHFRVYNCDNEKYLMNFVDRALTKKRAGIHVDTISKVEFLRILETIPDAKA